MLEIFVYPICLLINATEIYIPQFLVYQPVTKPRDKKLFGEKRWNVRRSHAQYTSRVDFDQIQTSMISFYIIS